VLALLLGAPIVFNVVGKNLDMFALGTVSLNDINAQNCY
jgi:hypothetical protein